MKDQVLLVIVFNHRYDKNIGVLASLYAGRFSNIKYLVPFYNGDRKDVISVYENSLYFQGYIAQGYSSFHGDAYRHYLFIADDMVLNPVINETNYTEHFNLDAHSSFLPELLSLHERGMWPRVKEAYEFTVARPGVEVAKELPSFEDALDALSKKNLVLKPLNSCQVSNNGSILLRKPRVLAYILRRLLRLKSRLLPSKVNLPYPLIGSYSDILVVSSESIKRFCHYCGVFAATDLHVEIAIPTALLLSTSQIVVEKDLRLRGKALWTAEDYEEMTKYNSSLEKLLAEFPANYLYLHPIKLSKWT